MKQGWGIKRIVDVAEKIFAGGDKPKLFSETETDILRVPVYANGVTNNGLCGYTDKCTVEQKCITISARGTIGFCCIRDTPFVPIVRLITIIPSKDVDLKYLYYAIGNSTISNSGTSIPQLTVPMIRELLIPVPPIAEQKRIVEILDREFEKIDALKANAERSLQQAKDLFQSALKQELKPKEGWVTASLNDLYDVRDGTHDSPKYTQQGYPFVTSKNLKDGKIDMSDVKYISKEDYDKINERSKVDVGDILFAMIGSNLGHPALVVDEPNYAIKNVALFKVPSSQSSRLLLYLLSSDLIMDKINKEKSGSSQPFVSLKYLRTFKVSIPMEYEQQEELALRIERLDRISKRLQSKYINIIALCDDMKQALLRQAFNGEL